MGLSEGTCGAVFGSPRVLGDNVMLAVATSDVLVGPTRLLFPRAAGGVGEAAGFPFSLLGAHCAYNVNLPTKSNRWRPCLAAHCSVVEVTHLWESLNNASE